MDLQEFFLFAGIGFIAQFVDGAVGMAYGIINMLALLSLGIPPASASASVHSAEVITTGFSGLFHAMFKNIHKKLFLRLVIPGVIGSAVGAFLLTRLPIQVLKPGIGIYLLAIGCYIFIQSLKTEGFWDRVHTFFLHKVLRHDEHLPEKARKLSPPIGFFGGLFDAMGGGGWGAIVTSSLIAQGATPRYTIGSVILAEFLIALSSSVTFYMTIGIHHWGIILGLISGGILAAPLGAYFAQNISKKLLMRLVSALVILISFRLLLEPLLS